MNVAQHNTEINLRSAAKDPHWHSGIHGYSSTELPPAYRSTPPRSDYDLHTEMGENDDELGPPTEFHMINVYCNNTEIGNELQTERVMLGDSAANGFILNDKLIHLAEELEPCVGTVW